MHRDIKLNNFLYEHDGDDAEIKLIDFGIAVEARRNATHHAAAAPPLRCRANTRCVAAPLSTTLPRRHLLRSECRRGAVRRITVPPPRCCRDAATQRRRHSPRRRRRALTAENRRVARCDASLHRRWCPGRRR